MILFKRKYFLLFILLLNCHSFLNAQRKDTISRINSIVSTQQTAKQVADSVKIKKRVADSIKYANHIPKIATRRSLIIPGWGQAYNGEYWKIPIVYGLLSIPVVTYIYNQDYYKKTKFAFEAKFKAENYKDSSDLPFIDPELVNLSTGSLQNYRNQFRRNRDYSYLWFLIAWGLQIADATVFAHLKQFNVSNDLSMEINPTFNPYTRTPAISVSLNLKEPQKKAKDLSK